MAEIIGEKEAYETEGGGFSVGLAESETEKFIGEKSKIEAKAKDYKYGENNVSGITLNYLEGGMAELIISYSRVSTIETNEGDDEPLANYECTFVQDSLPLAMHPLFPEDKLDEWRKFLASPESVQAKKKYLVNPSDVNSKEETVSDEIIKAVELFNKGIQTFLTYNPVVSKVQVYAQEPTTLNTCGMIEAPPKWSNLARSWLKTADNISFDGNAKTWTRTQQWTGAYEWASELYDKSPVSGD